MTEILIALVIITVVALLGSGVALKKYRQKKVQEAVEKFDDLDEEDVEEIQEADDSEEVAKEKIEKQLNRMRMTARDDKQFWKKVYDTFDEDEIDAMWDECPEQLGMVGGIDIEKARNDLEDKFDLK